jgi:hypothetical protein
MYLIEIKSAPGSGSSSRAGRIRQTRAAGSGEGGHYHVAKLRARAARPREALVLSIAGVTAIMLIESLMLLTLF